MIHDLGQSNSIISQFVAELRDVQIQVDRQRFRRNLERIGEAIGYEISKVLPYITRQVQTPLGTAPCAVLSEQPVLGTILRAGLALHQGMINVFDQADAAYVSAYRKHRPDGSFEIQLDYVSCPDLNNRILIVSDPMLATGLSLVGTLRQLLAVGFPKQTHFVCAIACKAGIERVQKELPHVHIWAGAIDAELNDKAYIVPGLGDAGDLAFGGKLQS